MLGSHAHRQRSRSILTLSYDRVHVTPSVQRKCIPVSFTLLCEKLPLVSIITVCSWFQRGTVDRDLKWREKTNTHIPVVDLLKLFVQICDGIKMFHCSRPTPLAHRDIKPSNVLLSPDGTPVVMDLGEYDFCIIISSTHLYLSYLYPSFSLCRLDCSRNRVH